MRNFHLVSQAGNLLIKRRYARTTKVHAKASAAPRSKNDRRVLGNPGPQAGRRQHISDLQCYLQESANSHDQKDQRQIAAYFFE